MIAQFIFHQEWSWKATQGIEKALGPDNIPDMVLKELSQKLSPAVTAFYTNTLDTETIPKDWTNATIYPVFRKGNVHLAANYRPVLLVCILNSQGAWAGDMCLLFLCKYILESGNILTPLQHGFHCQHACET